jgi:hypothetical protein
MLWENRNRGCRSALSGKSSSAPYHRSQRHFVVGLRDNGTQIRKNFALIKAKVLKAVAASVRIPLFLRGFTLKRCRFECSRAHFSWWFLMIMALRARWPWNNSRRTYSKSVGAGCCWYTYQKYILHYAERSDEHAEICELCFAFSAKCWCANSFYSALYQLSSCCKIFRQCVTLFWINCANACMWDIII